MANISLNENAQLNLEMEAMTVNTEGHCDEWNVRHKQLLENDKYLNQQINDTKESVTKKVDKVEGKGLSTCDYTTAEKNKLSGIASGANKTVIDSALSDTSTNTVQNKVIKAAIDAKGAPVYLQETAPSDTSGLWAW